MISSLEPGSGTYLSQDTQYLRESCKRMLRRTAPCGPPEMATHARLAYCRRDLYFYIACRSTWQLSSAPSPPVESEFCDRDAKYVLHTRAEAKQCFVCKFLGVPRCQGQIAPKKTHCLSCLT